MPGNLNLKKSWHPGLKKNQEAVWKKEQAALEERKKIQEKRKEIQREREQAELQALQDQASGKQTTSRRMEWMYNTASTKEAQDEEYLLGKRKIDLTSKQVEDQEREKDLAQTEKAPKINPNDDPLTQIRKKQIDHAKRHSSSASSSKHRSRSRSPERRKHRHRHRHREHRDRDRERHSRRRDDDRDRERR